MGPVKCENHRARADDVYKYEANHTCIQCSFCNLARGNHAGQVMMSLIRLCIFEMAMATDKGAEVKPDCEERETFSTDFSDDNTQKYSNSKTALKYRGERVALSIPCSIEDHPLLMSPTPHS